MEETYHTDDETWLTDRFAPLHIYFGADHLTLEGGGGNDFFCNYRPRN